MGYIVKMTQEDCVSAIKTYLRYRRYQANLRRIEDIHKLIERKRKSFLGFVYFPEPKCKNVREAIRYMKSNAYQDGIFSETTLWGRHNRQGLNWEEAARSLLERIDAGHLVGDIALDEKMAFLATYFVEKDSNDSN